MSQVLSPLPGTFYVKPSPEAAPYKAPGDAVVVGDVLGLVEVMKTFIEIKAEFAGTFTAYIAEDGLPVMAAQALAEVAE
ncbi:biotin carboxyl carrier domain-containing protein [Roseovarius faecimaris]|uniref:Biotin carboxyl carrier protein of acetyl-CoA carboxylase n=1 Tax=Roseovarius faecimaris TaxID=2494550 RepID=A0A6I6ITP5_9RHOB|nr:acetyl-CoA carboxylase [Roseovarius faecimaris]QGX99572.1 biotin carboxyl carrier domain-containing protein [Roseovarius faecimaris]